MNAPPCGATKVWSELRPGTFNPGDGMVQPSCPFPMASYAKGTNEKKNAAASDHTAR